jgi:tetratricopeptide (TPR) repeat protein
MLACKHCTTPNTLDASFCKKCGTALPEEDLKEAQAKLDALITEGIAMFNAGRIPESLAVAEAVLESNPSMISAMALKGDGLAHQGDIASAIEAYEWVVAKNPDSALDRIRLNQLRNSLVLAVAPTKVDRRPAWIGAVSAMVLVVSVALLLMRDSLFGSAGSQVAQNFTATGDSKAFLEPETGENAQQFRPEPPGEAPTTGNPAPGEPQQTPQDATETQAPPPAPSSSIGLPRAPAVGDGLPRPSESGPALDTEVVPVRPNPSGLAGDIGSSSSRPVLPNPAPATPPRPAGSDEDPAIVGGESKASEAPEDEGQISITVRQRPRHETTGGVQAVDGGNSGVALQALERTAQQQLQLGNFAAAANTLEQALRAGGDPVRLNQRLGQALAALGRKSDALAAYRRSQSAAEQAIAQGRGNRERNQASLDIARQAIRNLEGG